MKNFVEENDKILEQWKCSNEQNFGETNFADDGIMYVAADNEKEYELWANSPLRILFLTKDQNAGGGKA